MEKIEKFLKNDSFQIISEDVGYFLQDYKGQNELEENLLQKCTGKIFKLSIAGTCLGISLSLSLRRYMPNTFGEFTPIRLLVETTLVFGGYYNFTQFATKQAYGDLYKLRKGVLLDNNQEYLKFLIGQYKKYPDIYKQPTDIFKNIFTDEELIDWKNKYQYDLNYLFQ